MKYEEMSFVDQLHIKTVDKGFCTKTMYINVIMNKLY